MISDEEKEADAFFNSAMLPRCCSGDWFKISSNSNIMCCLYLNGAINIPIKSLVVTLATVYAVSNKLTIYG